MTESKKAPTRERRSIWRVGPEQTWATVLPVAFIIISLLSLVLLPIVVSSRTTRMRNEIFAIAEPARREANEIQRLYASYARNGLSQKEVRTLERKVDRVHIALRKERRDHDGRRG